MQVVKGLENLARQCFSFRFPFESQVMTGILDLQQKRLGRDQLQCGFYLSNRRERIARAVDEESWRPQSGKVLRTQLLRFARRMEGIREQKQTICQPALIRTKHRCLASAVRMPAQKYLPGDPLAHGLHGSLQTFTITRGIPWMRRAEWPLLTKRQIAAKHGETRAGKGFGQRDQNRSLAV